jgi:hypothetical protein
MRVRKIVELSGWEVYQMVKVLYPFATGVDGEGLTIHLEDDAPDVTGEEINALWPAKQEAYLEQIKKLRQRNKTVNGWHVNARHEARDARRERDKAKMQGGFASVILSLTTIVGWGLLMMEIL